MKRRREEVLVNMTGTHEERECDWEKGEERRRRRRKGVLLKRTKTPIGTRKRNVTGKRKKRG